MKTSSSAQRNLALQPHLVLVSSAVQSDGQMQRLAIVQLTCSSQIQYQRDAGQRSFKHIILRTEICRAAASSRACQLSRAGLSVSLYTCHVWYPYMRCSSVYCTKLPRCAFFAFDSNRGRAMQKYDLKQLAARLEAPPHLVVSNTGLT